MEWWIFLLIAVGGALAVVLLTALICYLLVFYSGKRRMPSEDEYEIPDGEIYEAHREQIVEWIKLARTYPHEDVEIISHDGLSPKGKYYECNKNNAIFYK